jgi:hypothetical protein
VQVLDLGYEQQWLQSKGKHSDWFTSHGDVFPVGSVDDAGVHAADHLRRGRHRVHGAAMRRAAQLPDEAPGAPAGEWNHYYVRAMNGESAPVGERRGGERRPRLQAGEGFLALEAEGAKVEYRNLRLRELP